MFSGHITGGTCAHVGGADLHHVEWITAQSAVRTNFLIPSMGRFKTASYFVFLSCYDSAVRFLESG